MPRVPRASPPSLSPTDPRKTPRLTKVYNPSKGTKPSVRVIKISLLGFYNINKIIRTWLERNENNRHKSNLSRTIPLPPRFGAIDDAESRANAGRTIRRLQTRRQELRGAAPSFPCPARNDANACKIHPAHDKYIFTITYEIRNKGNDY